MQLAHRRIEAVLVADPERHAALLCFGEHALRVLGGEGHRLFHKHVFPRPDAIQGDAGVVAALRRDGAGIDAQLLQHFMIVGIYGRLFTRCRKVVGGLLLRPFRYGVADGDEFHNIAVGGRGGNVVF